ncbi:hypothetical protein LCGC14_1102070 [marine sediment metagenome]|uniref:Uncharacterized protein n=1 Tax=marine sediment metagenome TaxID=412755 RepID=A0A0F9PSG2_9ZZZZ
MKTAAGATYPQTRCALGVRYDNFHRLIPPPAGYSRLGAELFEMYTHFYPERAAKLRAARRGMGPMPAPPHTI